MAFRLYIDEVGHDDLGSAHDERYRYLSLSGVIMSQSYDVATATPALNKLKADIFNVGPNEFLCLHRKDIIQKKGPFGVLADETLCAKFDEALISYLTSTKFRLLTAVIDKVEMMKKQHWNQQHPYHFLMEILVEKYTQWLERNDGTGDIMPEERKGKKDRALQLAYDGVRSAGTRFVDRARIEKAIPAAKLKFRSKMDNETGLQICDLVAHPSHNLIRKEQGHDVTVALFAEKILTVLKKDKYDRSWWGKIQGYGTKYLP